MAQFLRARFIWLSALSLLGTAYSYALPVLSADEIVSKAVAAGNRQTESSPVSDYAYTKVTVTDELDADGNLKDRQRKVYDIAFRGGTTRVRLVEVNGHAPTPDELKKQAESQINAREALGRSPKGDVNRENFLTPDLVSRFNYSLDGTEMINGRKSYVLSFRPKAPGASGNKLVDRLIDRLNGKLWIDAEEFEVAKADLRLGSEVTVLGGIAGTLKKMAFTMNRSRMREGVWFSTFTRGDFQGRKLIESLRIRTSSESTNFRPLS